MASKATVQNNLSSRFNPEDYQPKFKSAEEFVNIPLILDAISINEGTTQEGAKFKACRLTVRQSEDGEQEEVNSSAMQVVALMTAVQNAIETEDGTILPAWGVFKKKEMKSGRMATQWEWKDEMGIPKEHDVAF